MRPATRMVKGTVASFCACLLHLAHPYEAVAQPIHAFPEHPVSPQAAQQPPAVIVPPQLPPIPNVAEQQLPHHAEPVAEPPMPEGDVPVVGSIEEARSADIADDAFIIRDEHSEVTFFRQFSVADGADTELNIHGVVYGTAFTDEVSMLAYECGGTCHAQLQHALNTAAMRNIGVALSPRQHYVLNEGIIIPQGVRYIDGNEALVDVKMTGTEDAPASAMQFVQGAQDINIVHLTLDLADAPYTRGIAGNALRNIIIAETTMLGVSYRGIEFAAHGGDAQNIRIERNRIENTAVDDHANDGVIAVALTTDLNVSDDPFSESPSPQWDRYTTHGTVSPGQYKNNGVSVVGNVIRGGYYGVSFTGVTQSEIRDNEIIDNARSIGLQSNSQNNIVEHNTLRNSNSSGVHIAYNSNNNQVVNNTVFTEKAHGQGLLQAHSDSDDNVFRGNAITVVGEQQPNWMLYTGPDCDNTQFLNNTIDGAAQRAFVGVESIWDGTSIESNLAGDATNTHSFMMQGAVHSPLDDTLISYGGGRESIHNVTVEENVFTPRNEQTPLIYIGAEVTGGRVGNERIVGDIDGVSLAHNTIVGNRCAELLKIHTGERPDIGQATVHFIDESVGEYTTN